MHLQQPSNALGASAASIEHSFTRLQLAGIDTNESQLADKWIGHDLEGQGGKGLAVRRLTRNRFAIIGVCSMNLARVKRRWQIVHDRIQQGLDAFVLECRADHNWE